ncbi:MAG: RIP metalloprotease RseP [Kiritimatiellaeota bacterium]|nr:RIP metalloprotease RseP [Kiritimatiellota bacterium]
MMGMLAGFGMKVLFWAGGLLLLGLAIFVHEFGHFLAARWLGFKVEVFSLGFGPAIWKRKVNGIEYKVCWIPFGGYVAVPQLDPSGMERLQGETDAPKEALPDMPPWKRIIVSVAGPLGNVVLAVVLAHVIFWMPGAPSTVVLDTRVGHVRESSEAWAAGLRDDDRILSVNGTRIDNWMGLGMENALAGTSGTVTLQVEREGGAIELEMPLQKDEVHGFYEMKGVFPKMPSPVVAKVTEGFPAEQAGVRAGDVLRTVDGQIIWSWEFFVMVVMKKGEEPLKLGVTRDGEDIVFEMTPQLDKTLDRVLVGIAPVASLISSGTMFSSPWEQIKGDALMVERILRGLLKPKTEGERTAVAKNIGGPFMILDVLQTAVQSGAVVALGFLRMICVNLAILNLLPIPVLDGGHIMFALYEVVTRRKPHPRVVAALVNAFAILLIGLMLFLVGRDITRKVDAVKLQRNAEKQMMQQMEKRE